MPYVISIKRKQATTVNPEGWEYFGYDRYCGSFSSGYPIFMTHNYETFKSIEEAEETFNKNKKDLLSEMHKYDISTLAIRKIIYKSEKRLIWKDN